jgi:hypothetical protein
MHYVERIANILFFFSLLKFGEFGVLFFAFQLNLFFSFFIGFYLIYLGTVAK